jgi:hypothetical protein
MSAQVAVTVRVLAAISGGDVSAVDFNLDFGSGPDKPHS